MGPAAGSWPWLLRRDGRARRGARRPPREGLARRETDAVRPGQPLTVGIRLEMEKGWHTYWRNPGDSGLPTRVKWDLPPGLHGRRDPVAVPEPLQRRGPLVSYGYEDEVLLPVEIRVPRRSVAGEVAGSRAGRLARVPGGLPAGAGGPLAHAARARDGAPGPQAALFAEARRRLPRKDPAWRFSVSSAARAPEPRRPAPRGAGAARGVLLPADAAGPRPRAARRRSTRRGAVHRLALARDPNGAPTGRLAGVLVAGPEPARSPLDVDVPLASRPAPGLARSRRESRRLAFVAVALAVASPPRAPHLAAGRGRRRRPGPRLTLADSTKAARSPRRLRGQDRRPRVVELRVPVRGEALRQREHAEAAEGVDGEGRRLAHQSAPPAPGKQGYVDAAKANALVKEKGGARPPCCSTTTEGRPRLRREDDTPHVRDRPQGHGRLRRRHRRQAARRTGRHRHREELRLGRARRGDGRQGRSRSATASPTAAASSTRR